MASPNVYPNGVGATTGATLATVEPLMTSGDIWYVAAGGVDAATPRGKERIRPLATLGQAMTNAANGDIIVLGDSYTEEVGSSGISISKALTIISEGSGVNRARFTRTGAANVNLFNITSDDVVLWNIWFAATSNSAATATKVKTANVRTHLIDCYFEQGANDTGPALEYVTGAGSSIVESTTFISTATTVASQPANAITVTNAMTSLLLDTVVFSGGTTGWSNPYAFNGAAAITRLRAINCDLLLDSDVTLATGTTGWWNTRNSSGSARVVWAA